MEYHLFPDAKKAGWNRWAEQTAIFPIYPLYTYIYSINPPYI